MLQRELNVAVNLEKAPKKSEEEEVEPNIVPLKEAYLSFNRWLDQVEDLNLELEPFFQKPLRVPSSHEISFVQFCHRLQRESSEPEELRKALEAFERFRQNGVDLNLPETEFEPEASDSGTSEFRLLMMKPTKILASGSFGFVRKESILQISPARILKI